jgi:hypothetical protein
MTLTRRHSSIGKRELLRHLGDPLGARRLGCVVAGPGSGLSEEPMSGVGSVALDCRVVPECPPGPVASRRLWSASICADTMLDSRRLRARMACMGVLPAAFLASR